MLCLSRHPEESIILFVPPSPKPTQIRVLVREVYEHQVKLGFDADKSVEILREELVGANGSVRLNHLPR